MIIEDHDVVVAGAGWGWEFASLVSVDLAQRLDNAGKAGMELVAIRQCIGVVVCQELGLDVFGGPLVLLALIQMSLVHGHGDGWEASQPG